MQELTIWITYHEESQINQYHLHEDSVFRLFKGNSLNVEGLNINHLNSFYAEITTMYWVWKNKLKSKNIGFCHYRRQFTHYFEIDKGTCQILHIQRFPSIYQQYKGAHNYHDYDDIVDILDNKYGKGNPYSEYLTKDSLFIPFCCFIMHWEDFDRLCNFLFPVLFEFDRRNGLKMKAENYRKKTERDFPHDDTNYQQRAVAFLAERLISCYIVIHLNTICISSTKKRID
jgi:hypothetical protein